MADLDSRAAACGFTDYMAQHVTYPPRGPLPIPAAARVDDHGYSAESCSLWYEILMSALAVNPAFNPYRIFDVYPVLWDVLGSPCVLLIILATADLT